MNQKWPKMAKNGQKWPNSFHSLSCPILALLHIIKSSLVITITRWLVSGLARNNLIILFLHSRWLYRCRGLLIIVIILLPRSNRILPGIAVLLLLRPLLVKIRIIIPWKAVLTRIGSCTSLLTGLLGSGSSGCPAPVIPLGILLIIRLLHLIVVTRICRKLRVNTTCCLICLLKLPRLQRWPRLQWWPRCCCSISCHSGVLRVLIHGRLLQ